MTDRQMKRLKRALEGQMAADRMARFDWFGFGIAMKNRLKADGRTARKVAQAIGVTPSTFSRAMSHANVDAGAVFAIAGWLGREARGFYLPPEISDTCTSIPVKHQEG